MQVKSQGTICKSSWAFSVTGALEAQHRKVWGQLVSLSEQQLIDCSGVYGNNGCTGGSVQNGFEYVHRAGGICAEKSYSYLGYVSYLQMWENIAALPVLFILDNTQFY